VQFQQLSSALLIQHLHKEVITLILIVKLFNYEICALLGHYAALRDSPLPKFRDNVSVPSSRVKNSKFLTLEDGTDTLSRNVGKGLPVNAA
jgi:hypothetical protein